MIAWRDGLPGGIEVFNALDDTVLITTNFSYQASGNTLTAMIPLADIGLTPGQTIAISAFQEGSSDGWAVDWMESATLSLAGLNPPTVLVKDPQDMADSSGDIRAIGGQVMGDKLYLSMTVEKVAAPATEQTPVGMNNRYYYHWLLDTDNNPATGRSNSEYEGNPTGVVKPVGAELAVMIAWRDGLPGGIEVFNALDDTVLITTNFSYQASGNTLTCLIPLADIGLTPGQTIAISAFQEGSSDGWAVDWMESATLTLTGPAVTAIRVTDPQDMADSSGDIRKIDAHVEGTNLILGMTIEAVAAPATEQTPVGMNNRYYYHWLLDTDNNPATGRSNSEYEGNPTGVVKPVGAELAVMIAWRDGLPGGIEVFNALDDTILITTNFTYQSRGNTLRAVIPLANIGLTVGQTIAVSAFQEGSSDGWAVDWMESAVLTLEPPVSDGSGMTLATEFTGDPVSFTILVQDDGATQVDTNSVVVKLDGNPITVTVTKTGGTTTITGRFPTLLPPNTVHTINLALVAGGKAMSKDFVLQVDPYTVLSEAQALQKLNTANKGFVVNVTQISSAQTGVSSLHTNIAALAEKQLAGQMKDETGTITYYNEASDDSTRWKINSEVLPGGVNWYELAPGVDASLNFTNDEAIPRLATPAFPLEGVVVEILTYVDLAAGYHKLGLYTEGGHKITAGFRPADAVLSLVDNSVSADTVPSYYARNRFFDLIATKPGYYPIRVLWFQSKRDQEQGLMLELFSVLNKQLHLMNSATDPDSLRAYRAGALTHPGAVTPTMTAQEQGGNLVLQWTGMLQLADGVGGSWADYADESQSPLPLPMSAPMKFARARSY
jgi:hypothetical protein